MNRSWLTFARLAGSLSVGMGLFVLAGWILGVPWIKSLLPGAVEMKANTAVGLLLAGVALALLDGHPARWRSRVGQGLGLIVAGLGFATAGEYALGWNLGIDELLFRDTANLFNPFRGRMSPGSAVVFAAMGLGLAALPIHSLRWLVQAAAALTLLIGGLSFIGYLWNASELVTDRLVPPVAIHTAATFLALGWGMLMAGSPAPMGGPGLLASLSSVESKVLAGFLATLLLLLLAGGATYKAAADASQSARLVAHTQQVRGNVGRLYAAISDAESQQRNYLLSGGGNYLADFKRHAAAAARQAEMLARLVADNPGQARKLGELQALMNERMALLQRGVVTLEQSGLGAAQAMIRSGEGRNLMNAIRTLVSQMDAAEGELLTAREEESTRNQARTLLSMLVTAAAAVAGFMMLFSGIRREMATRAEAEAERDRFFTLSLDLLCIANTDGYFKRVNPAFTKTLGWSEGEILARPFIDLIHPDDRAATLAEVGKLAAGVPTLHFENRYQCRDGSWKTLSWRVMPQPGGALYGTGRDMTEFKLAEEALRRSEESLAVTLNSIGDAVLATDTGGRVTRLNPVAEHLTGWTEAEARGRPVAEVFRIVNGQTRAPAAIPVHEVLATGAIQGLANHTLLIARDGAERPIADSAAPIRGKDGRTLGVVLVFRDVTEEEKAENALRQIAAIVEFSNDAIIGKTLDGVITSWNPSAERLFGYTAAEIIGAPVTRLFPPDRLDEEPRIVESLRRGEPVEHFETVRVAKDGRHLHVSATISPIKDHSGAIVGASKIVRDITEGRRAAEAVRQLNASLKEQAAQLESANQELGAFSYSVSHDLRAPLRHVQGYVQMLAREAQAQLSDKGRHYMKTIADASKDMGQLIDDLLSFSRMGRAEMREGVALLDELAQAGVRQLELATRDRKIVWKIAPLPRVVGDLSMLRQVFANLLGNAVKYTGPRDPAEIEVGCAGEEDGRLVLFVRDNGVGFDPQYAHKLFGVFQRLHRAEEFEGTGIGLANVRRIIARHGGRTWAESKLGAGATFYFTLKPAPAL